MLRARNRLGTARQTPKRDTYAAEHGIRAV
jgi:hypothetical protein